MSSSFVLVPGPWMGAWVWEHVTRGLRALGHEAYPITLSGLDDPLTDVSDIGPETHVDDVLSVLEKLDLRDAILVGHSYGGLVAAQVADRVPDRVVRTVFVEGFLPHDGQSMLHAFPRSQHTSELELITLHRGRWPVPDAEVMADGQDLTLTQARRLVERCVGHPGRTISEPVTMSRPLDQLCASYVVCQLEHFGGLLSPDVQAMRDQAAWTFHSLDTGHWPMVSAPRELVSLLDDIAGQRG
ncbi:alpha/beta fold hydrolase [Nonomuraea jiangxiensis]|uniref:Pimeloyl-ACP methyl ester carboxylesterase n=1 Tax=Nonomuraea jiangxiensis TaxID=633440 RepID=A0A1G8IJK9_9ACTN|nr:alpha/beta hydrolase [Nonomuraea jiangxiensis]SDI19228.1 Pimeloyl-ACP methyl ester carboxylesterase [Nonomuraea jiangxiensis]